MGIFWKFALVKLAWKESALVYFFHEYWRYSKTLAVSQNLFISNQPAAGKNFRTISMLKFCLGLGLGVEGVKIFEKIGDVIYEWPFLERNQFLMTFFSLPSPLKKIYNKMWGHKAVQQQCRELVVVDPLKCTVFPKKGFSTNYFLKNRGSERQDE